jgi:hypothetical protein
MPIKATTDAEVRTLVEALGAEEPARREGAIARLLIIGSRAVGRLVTAYDSTDDRRKRLAILRVLEASADERALGIARKAIAEKGDLAVAGVAVLRELVTRGAGSTHASALETLLTLSTEFALERRVRAAAAEALEHAPDDIRAAVGATLPAAPSAEDALWEDAADGRLPDEPAALRDALAAHVERTPLPVLRRMIECVRDREQAATPPARRDDWQTLRGALHQALALRGSRIALYDLRETVESTTKPLPPSFLAAIHVVGDASCLEPIATAFARAAQHDRWRHQLAETFHAVAKRERLTTKHSAIRRALARSPELAHRA